MCRSRREGGQRCHAHALKEYQRAKAAYDKSVAQNPGRIYNTIVFKIELEKATADLAATPAGRDDLTREKGLLQPEELLAGTMAGLRRADAAAEMAALSKETRKAKTASDRTFAERKKRFADLVNRRASGSGFYAGAAMAAVAAPFAPSNAGALVGLGGVMAGGAVVDYFKNRYNDPVWRPRSERDLHHDIADMAYYHDPELTERAVQEINASIDRVEADEPEVVRDHMRAQVRASADQWLSVKGWGNSPL